MTYSQFTLKKVVDDFNTIYGAVTNGTLWRFLKLEEKTVTIDLSEYLLPPSEPIMGRLVQMVQVASKEVISS